MIVGKDLVGKPVEDRYEHYLDRVFAPDWVHLRFGRAKYRPGPGRELDVRRGPLQLLLELLLVNRG